MSNFSPFRILLADDDPVVRRSLQVIIEADPAFSVIGSAADGAEAALLYNTLKPDVVLLDIRVQPMTDWSAASRSSRPIRTPGFSI